MTLWKAESLIRDSLAVAQVNRLYYGAGTAATLPEAFKAPRPTN
jgi:hypothetical protein